MRFTAALVLFFGGAWNAIAAIAAAPATYRIEIVSPPTPANAACPSLATAPDGTVWLIWLESLGVNHALRCAAFDAASNRWLEPRTIASGPDLVASAAETPLLTAGTAGHLTAAWPVSTGGVHHVVYRSSNDAGRTWSAVAPLTRETSGNEFAALTTLADGRVLAAWLDGRASTKTAIATRLYSRIIEPRTIDFATTPDTLVDARVCDCCAPSLSPFPDGSALLAYRGRTADEIRDVQIARFSDQGWSASHAVNSDRWHLVGCPVNGPRLASDGGRVAAAWFTGADNEPRVQLSTSPDAGTRFLMPLKVDHGRPTGHVDTVLLHDDAALVTWLEGPSADTKAPAAGLWLRRASPQFSLDEPVLLASAVAAQPTGFPRAVLLRDFAGDSITAQILVAYLDSSGIRTLSVTVPEADLIAATADTCNCSPPAAQLVGFPIRGTVVAGATNGGLSVAHPEFPGLFSAGTHRFRAGPSVIASLPPGREFIGLIEKRGGEWWVFDVRLLVAAPAKK